MNITLKLENIFTVRNDTIINSNVSFVANNNHALVLRGKNGVGKTTLMRAIAGFLPIENGTIFLNNDIVTHDDLVNFCHFIGEDNALKENYTIEDDLQHWASISGIKNPDIKGALDAFRITTLANTKTTLLSQGQKKRVALSRLLVLNRPIWLLDEPTNGLDKSAVTDLNTVIERHLINGGIVICASHIGVDFTHTEYVLENSKSEIAEVAC